MRLAAATLRETQGECERFAIVCEQVPDDNHVRAATSYRQQAFDYSQVVKFLEEQADLRTTKPKSKKK